MSISDFSALDTALRRCLSSERYLSRYPGKPSGRRVPSKADISERVVDRKQMGNEAKDESTDADLNGKGDFHDEDVRQSWNKNAEKWCDDVAYLSLSSWCILLR